MVGVPIFQPASRKMAQTKISNINRPLRLNQKQELRVNTGKGLLSWGGVYSIKNNRQPN